jgi:hypothetical protein
MNSTCATGRALIPAATVIAAVLAAGSASAQPFEYVFGEKNTVETGARRVKPVQVCPDGGFVAVGTTANSPAPNDAYLVRTKEDGTPVWEIRYDIGPGNIDHGQALAEAADGSGFVVLGTTQKAAGSPTHAYLLKVKCDGGPVWAQVYESTSQESGFDLVEARTGDPLRGTRPGDLLVAGAARNPAGHWDAMLFRTRSNGALIWNWRYDNNSSAEFFRGLTEARPTGGGGTGDVVAAGLSLNLGGPSSMGFTMRVNGNTGLVGAAPQDAVVYRFADHLAFESVVELQQSAFASELVVTGAVIGTSTTTSSDVLLVKTKPDPVSVLGAIRIGDTAAHPLGAEWAYDLHEVSNPLAIARPGDLALTGRAAAPAGTDAEAFLLVADPDSLKPLTRGRLYGDHDSRRDWGMSVSDHPRGFVIAGTSESDFEHASDPSDLYLIGADDSGKTSCVKDWEPRHEPIHPEPTRISPSRQRFLEPVRVDVRAERQDTAYPNCP